MTRILSVTSVLLLATAQLALAAGPHVDIVIGEKAPALEKRAAEDIAADLKKVYDAEVKIATAAPEGAENVIFVGIPAGDDEAKKLVAAVSSRLLNQDHAVTTIKYRGRPALVIAGGNAGASYWAAAEYAHSLGIRSLLYGDVYPAHPKPFTLDGHDILLSPPQDQSSSLPEFDPFPTGFTAWGLADYQRLLRQRARLKVRTINLGLHTWQPFIDFEIDGVKKQTGVLWYGWQFPVSGDTAGRAAFKGAKFFENPDFSGATTYEKRLTAGRKWLSGLIDEAHALGMTVEVTISPMEFPKEFAAVLDSSAPTTQPEKLVVRSLERRRRLEELTPHERVQFNAFRAAFSGVDEWSLDNGTDLYPHLHSRLVFDQNLSSYRSSRSRFGTPLSDEASCRELVTPICGEGVDASVFKASEQLTRAGNLLAKQDKLFAMPASDIIMKHYSNIEPVPEPWADARENYLGAMNDMYRANSRAREGGRSYTLYLARRCEFGYEYMNCVEATRKAGIAKTKKDTTEQRAQLEKAIESMNAACSALAAVARDQSDRGMIAVCNEFGYRPLQKELEKLDAEESK